LTARWTGIDARVGSEAPLVIINTVFTGETIDRCWAPNAITATGPRSGVVLTERVDTVHMMGRDIEIHMAGVSEVD
jgi:limonene-1,2-epoxide hydrolase